MTQKTLQTVEKILDAEMSTLSTWCVNSDSGSSSTSATSLVINLNYN